MHSPEQPSTLHSKPLIPPKPYTPNPKPYTPNRKPYTPSPKPYTPNPKPYSPRGSSVGFGGRLPRWHEDARLTGPET